MKPVCVFAILVLQSSVQLAQPLAEEVLLDVGDDNVYVEVRGPSDAAPLLIFLHGGPGNVVLGMLPFQFNVGRQLENEYLVAYVHQRGVGKSSPVPDAAHTFSNYIDDMDHVVRFLTNKYGQQKVYLVGHSWGGMLSLLYADRYQDKIQKLIFISAAMDFQTMLQDGYEATLDWAEQSRNAQAIENLSSIKLPFDTWGEFTTLSRWANQAGDGIAKNFDMERFLEQHSIGAQYPDWDVEQGRIARALFQELIQFDLMSAGSSLNVPILFISGARDTIVPEKTMRRDYEHYMGPKEFVLLEDSHHLPFIDQPDLVVQAITEFLPK